MDYVYHIFIMISIYAILAVSLNLMLGYTGLFSLAHAAFFGIGAYISALLTLNLGFSFWLAMLLAIIGTVVIGVLLAVPTLRLGGDYFILAVLGFQIVISGVLYNWVDLTRGPFGLYGLRAPSLFGFSLSSTFGFLLLAALMAIFLYVLANRMVCSPFGRVIRAIREDPVVAQVLGKDIVTFKILVFAIASGYAAIAGSLYAHYFTAINPLSFGLAESFFIVTMVVLGGSGSLRGSIVGAGIVVLFPEGLRFLNLPSAIAAPTQQIFFGLLLILFMRYRPQGILGEYRPR